jgi:transcriptional regulator with XRE-family HTH domain
MRVREARERRGWTQKALADRLTELGYPTSRTTVVKIEAGGRRANAPLSDVFAFAAALDIPPIHLLIPTDDEQRVLVTPSHSIDAVAARAWIRGFLPLPDADINLAELPESELVAIVRYELERQIRNQPRSDRPFSELAWMLVQRGPELDVEARRIAAEIRKPKEGNDG